MITHVKTIKKILFYSTVALICSIIIFPFILLFSYSLRTNTEIFSLSIKFVPRNPTLAAYKNVFFSFGVGGSTFINWASNSLIVGVSATIISLFIASLCGYGISRFRFYGRRELWFIIVLTQAVPWVVLLIPYYVLLGNIGILDKLGSLFLTYLAIFTPVSVWLCTGFFENIPIEIEEAARIDGCTHFSVFFRIVLPLAVPGLSAIALFIFVIGWSDYLLASILIRSVENWTLPLGLASFQGEHYILWAEIMAASTLITLPIVILFLYLQRYLIKGLMAGSIKQ